MDKAWQNVRSLLQDKLGQDIFNNWIGSLDYQKFDASKVTFRVPSRFIANWIESNYGESIIDCFKKEGVNVEALIFEHENQK